VLPGGNANAVCRSIVLEQKRSILLFILPENTINKAYLSYANSLHTKEKIVEWLLE